MYFHTYFGNLFCHNPSKFHSGIKGTAWNELGSHIKAGWDTHLWRGTGQFHLLLWLLLCKPSSFFKFLKLFCKLNTHRLYTLTRKQNATDPYFLHFFNWLLHKQHSLPTNKACSMKRWGKKLKIQKTVYKYCDKSCLKHHHIKKLELGKLAYLLLLLFLRHNLRLTWVVESLDRHMLCFFLITKKTYSIIYLHMKINKKKFLTINKM